MRSIFFLFLACTLFWGFQHAQAASNTQERRDYTAGTGHSAGGFSGTYIDPGSGDEVNTVIAPRQKQQQQETTPIYVYPQVTPTWPPTPGARPPMDRPTPYQQNTRR